MLKESGQIPGQISVAVGLLARLEVSGHLEIVQLTDSLEHPA